MVEKPLTVVGGWTSTFSDGVERAGKWPKRRRRELRSAAEMGTGELLR